MTDQHPLSDELISKNFSPHYDSMDCEDCEEICVGFDNDDLRRAADWQLEKVLAYIYKSNWFVEPGHKIAELHAAMRPQQQEES